MATADLSEAVRLIPKEDDSMVLKSILTHKARDSLRQGVILEELVLQWVSQRSPKIGIRPVLIALMTIKMLTSMSMLPQRTRRRVVDLEPNLESSEARKSMLMKILNWKLLTFGARKSQLIQSKINLDWWLHNRDFLKAKSNILNGILLDHRTVG